MELESQGVLTFQLVLSHLISLWKLVIEEKMVAVLKILGTVKKHTVTGKDNLVVYFKMKLL